MADQDTALPIRTEADGTDERIHVKIVDGTNPSVNQMEVDSDSNAHVESHGNDPGSVDRVQRLSEEGHTSVSGVHNGSTNTDPANIALIGHTRNATPGDTQSTERVTTIEDSGGTVRSLDMSLHDEDGEPYSSTNPVPVSIEESEGDEICDYDTAVAVVKDATDNHDYTVTALKTFIGARIWATASGKMKIEVQLEDAPAAGTYTTFAVAFNSTSTPNINMPLDNICGKQVAGAIIRIIRTNLDNQSQDLYSTLSGIEK